MRRRSLHNGVIVETRVEARKRKEQSSQRWRRFEQVYVIITLLLFAQAFFPFFQAGQMDSVADGNALLQTIWKLIYVIAAVLIYIHRKHVMKIISRDKLTLVLLLMIVLSSLWSAAPEITMRRSIAFVGTNLFAIYLATRFSLRELFQLIAWALLAGAVFSLIVTILFPELGTMMHEGNLVWRGIFSHKNQLGRIMSLAAIVFFLLILMKQWPRWLTVGGFLLSVLMLAMSESKTAMIVLLITMGCIPFLTTLRWNPYARILFWLPASLFFIGLCLAIFPHMEALLRYFGRDMTLTGRTGLWDIVIEMIQVHPWLGYGYSGFWLGWEGESAYVWMVTTWEPPNSHNGFLDAALDVGLIGLCLILFSFVSRLYKAMRYHVSSHRWENLWPLLYLIYLVLCNLTETTLLDHNSFFWTLFITLGFSLPHKKRAEQRGRIRSRLRTTRRMEG
ncbi:O-antigen ligase family protein [Brevibacillus invocatus]|uniref:O-antigen ligase family protein n=1 Tax=Brevibacillus invocatus TaxID=173959 RepID=A0A3M8CGF7_9BACL|nr:O-antigen ligase family protein [Brevibacillus invocatus]